MSKSGKSAEFDRRLREATEPELADMAAAEVILLRELAAQFYGDKIGKQEFSREATKAVARLSWMAEETERFGVVLPVIEFGEYARSFWRWFNWWQKRPRRGHWSKASDKKQFVISVT